MVIPHKQDLLRIYIFTQLVGKKDLDKGLPFEDKLRGKKSYFAILVRSLHVTNSMYVSCMTIFALRHVM